MNGADMAAAIKTRLSAISVANGYGTDLGARLYDDDEAFDEADTYPLAAIIEVNADIRQQACAVHEVASEFVVEAHYAAESAGGVIVPGYALLEDMKKAIAGSNSDYTVSGSNGSGRLSVTGHRIFKRERGSSIGVCQLRIQATYSENHAA